MTAFIPRRRVLKALAGLGVGSAVFRRALAAQIELSGTVTPEMIQQAEWIAGLKLSDDDRAATARGLARTLAGIEQLRAVKLDNSIGPALLFNPASVLQCAETSHKVDRKSVDRKSVDRKSVDRKSVDRKSVDRKSVDRKSVDRKSVDRKSVDRKSDVRLTDDAAPQRPAADDDLAFLPVAKLAALVHTREVSSVELTKLYLERLRRYDPVLRCVVTYTDELALKQAERADREIAAGHYRSALHGIPWGAKDLITWPGYRTSWGATPFKDQTIDAKATVAARLEEAGAVLVAKLSLGALAMGDRWFGGMTRNPWNANEGSSGSSAGSASATAAGLVGFALGSETLGSIVSPCIRCGATGLRPTFGRVSRYGCMTLAWSMDKIGPIARTVEDCAVIFGAIHGADGLDPTAVDHPYHWPSRRDLRTLRVGYVESNTPTDRRDELRVLRELGVQLVPIKMPTKYPIGPLRVYPDTGIAINRGFDEGSCIPSHFTYGVPGHAIQNVSS